YKLTLGTGGSGGGANGGLTEAGNPSSLTRAQGGQLIAGFAGADVWRQRNRAASDGSGGVGAPGGSSGGSGGDKVVNTAGQVESAAQAGGALQTPGYSGVAGQAGLETGRSVRTGGNPEIQANAGGGGGASVGSGGAGQSAGVSAVAGTGGLGAGGGGGSGGVKSASAGSSGGHGFIRLTLSEPAPTPVALAPVVLAPVPVSMPVPIVVMAPAVQRFSMSTDTSFEFGKATLKSAGESKLDSIVAKLDTSRRGQIKVTGHADRIGSEAANQRLSLNRADSVKSYLVSHSVPAERIVVAGRGETEPLTSSTDCQGPTSAKTIACLAPDRRVDIELVGIAQ
ncbi:MAG: OmpA family protein, partial [Rhodoferax sp.]|nr:OmpA family protein [Rhodoferax sp.]